MKPRYWPEPQPDGTVWWRCVLCGSGEHHDSSGPAKMLWHDNGRRKPAPRRKGKAA